MSDMTNDEEPTQLQELATVAPDVPLGTSHGIAAIALQMAMKYHDMTIVKDGAMYQQLKLEGKNIGVIGLADVFETAKQIERHLLGSEQRIAQMVIDALNAGFEKEGIEDPGEPEEPT